MIHNPRCAMAVVATLFLGAVAAGASDAAPDVTFTSVEGGTRTLASIDGPILLEFWASWCVPCAKGFDFLDGLRAREAGKLSIVAITMEEDRDAVDAFLRKHPSKLLVGRDPSGRSGDAYSVQAMPTTFLLDREHRIVRRFEGGGPSVHAEIEKAVNDLLGGQVTMAASEAVAPLPKRAVKAWERGYLADPIMNLDGDPLTRLLKEHVHASKEGAAGDGGVAGGGCGCN
ncbi:MAG: DUF4266 domain-containing protein [Acidobacteriota bacterium]